MPGAGQLHIQPVAVLGAGEPHQRPPPGQALGAVAGGGVGQVDPAVAISPLAAVQVPARQHHLPRVLAVHADGQGAGLGVEASDGAAGAVGHPQLGDGVAAAHHQIPHRQLEVLDLEAVLAEAAMRGYRGS
jgi:hypothetical protein